MKTIKKITMAIVLIAILVSSAVCTVGAASAPVIAFSKSSLEAGENVTVTVTVNPKKAMYGVAFSLEYDESILKYTGGSGTGSAGVLQVVESPQGEKSQKYSFSFSALKVGTSMITVNDCIYSTLSGSAAKEINFGGASAKITVKDKKLSDNAKLKSLKVSGYTLSPSFSPSKTNYTVSVPYSVTKVNVSAVTSDSEAKIVSVNGNSALKVGNNTVTVTTEAANGTQKKYTITVKRLEENEKETQENNQNSSISSLQTNVGGKEYMIVTELSEDILFKGFSIEKQTVNGFEVDAAVDTDKNYRIFYLMPLDGGEMLPFLYDSDTDAFEQLKYTVLLDNYYIFSQIPSEYNASETLYTSNITINGFSVECLSDSLSEMSDFHYVYCFSGGCYNLYRYDALEGTMQRFPDFEINLSVENSDENSIISRFSTLSTNGKVIIIALAVLVLGIFVLLIMLLAYCVRKFLYRPQDVILSTDYDDFEEIKINSEQNSEK